MTRWKWVRLIRRWMVWTDTHELILFVLTVTAICFLVMYGAMPSWSAR